MCFGQNVALTLSRLMPQGKEEEEGGGGGGGDDCDGNNNNRETDVLVSS